MRPTIAASTRRPVLLESLQTTRYMRGVGQIGRYLLLAGMVIAAAGVLLMVGERFGLGRLPGDIVWRRKNTTVYLPIVTSLVLSVVLTLLLNVLFRKK